MARQAPERDIQDTERAAWPSLAVSFQKRLATPAAQQNFRHVRRRYAALVRFADPAALLSFLHTRSTRHPEKNAIVTALVLMTREIDERELGSDLLWLALWPGLDAVYQRKRQFFVPHERRLVSTVCSAFLAALASLDLAAVKQVAATLVLNTERRVMDEVVRDAAETDREDAWEERFDPDEEPETGQPRAPSTSDGTEVYVLVLQWLRTLEPQDADLLFATLILGEKQQQVALRLGLTHSAVRKRLERGRARLLEHLAVFGLTAECQPVRGRA